MVIWFWSVDQAGDWLSRLGHVRYSPALRTCTLLVYLSSFLFTSHLDYGQKDPLDTLPYNYSVQPDCESTQPIQLDLRRSASITAARPIFPCISRISSGPRFAGNRMDQNKRARTSLSSSKASQSISFSLQSRYVHPSLPLVLSILS
jgi:hypothetical protein